MAAPALTDEASLPQAELTQLARVLARFLVGCQPTVGGTRFAGRRVGQGLDFLDFRDYQPGDDLRSIDWRASARSPRMQVRRYCGDVASDWFLCVDASASMGHAGGGKWRQARQLAAACAYVLLYLGHRVSVVLFSGGVDALCPLGRGHSQYARILKLLERSGPPAHGGGSDIGSCRTLLGQRDPVMVISDFLAEDAMLPALNSLLPQRRQVRLLQVSSDLDLTLENDECSLRDVESGLTAPCVERTVAEASARQRFTRLQRELTDWSRRYRVPSTICSSEQHWREVLLRHFMQD